MENISNATVSKTLDSNRSYRYFSPMNFTTRMPPYTMNMRSIRNQCMMLCGLALGAQLTFAAEPARQPDQVSRRTVINLNTHWLFKSGDIPNGQSDSLNEAGFEPVCLPHANAITPHRDIDMSSFRTISWYRRHFNPSPRFRGKRFLVEFQGVSQIADVFVNGSPVGTHKGAYTPFSFDITDKIRFGADNVLAVRADCRKHTGIPPEGISIDYMLFGGIARDVFMTITIRCILIGASPRATP